VWSSFGAESSWKRRQVIQHLLERGTRSDRSIIIASVRGQLVHLSKHKFASNVVDKVVLCADEEERIALCDEILCDPTAVSTMLKDQYGNYCELRCLLPCVVWSCCTGLQKMMLVATPHTEQRDTLIARVGDALLNIRKYSGT
jgi:pumilio RNA-binding family